MKNKSIYVRQLSEEIQQAIRAELVSRNDLTDEEIEEAMNSRLIDLEDTIDIRHYFD